jgi:ribonuclease D
VALTREQLEYAAALDAAVLPKLADTLMRKIDRAGLRKTYELERGASHTPAGVRCTAS